MKTKSIVLLMLALGCGLVATVGINSVMANRDAAPAGVEMVPIYVAAVEINLNDPVTKERIKLENWPADKIHPDALQKLEDIDGRRTTVKIQKGEPILNAKLLDKGEKGQGIGKMIPPGMRVVAVRVDDVAASGSLVRQGDRVDLLVHLAANPSRGLHSDTTRTFLQDVKVFAINDEVVRGATGEKVAVKSVSLLVTPEQAAEITLATELGRIRLIMRGDDDKFTEDPGNVSIEKLLGNDNSDTNRDKDSPTVKATAPEPEPVDDEEESEEEPFVMTLVMGGSEVKEFEFDPKGRVGIPRDEHGRLMPERTKVEKSQDEEEEYEEESEEEEEEEEEAPRLRPNK